MTEWKDYKFESTAKINPTESIPKELKLISSNGKFRTIHEKG